MPIYNREEVLGYGVGEKVYHESCFEGGDFDSVITERDAEDSLFVCDECGNEIK